MNPDWIAFLQANGATLNEEHQITFPPSHNATENRLYPVVGLTTFSVTGEDATAFLQGQLTCDIKQIQDDRASFAAFCNAKGRVISTLLVVKKDKGFSIILPQSLLDKVMNKLRMYILRAKVQLQDHSSRFCLLGLDCPHPDIDSIALPGQPCMVSQDDPFLVRLPGNSPRFLLLNDLEQSRRFWRRTVGSKLASAGASSEWDYQDLSAGIPWFGATASEQYIPQMLNIDKLGGISFDKGCYTGQEIVARTHYLGKAKRELVLAECSKTAMLNEDSTIIDQATRETAGHVVAFQRNERSCRLLSVLLPGNKERHALVLNNDNQDKIDIIPFQ